MPGPLEQPRSADDLYLAREADIGGVPVYRPIMTGDVFRDIDIPGVEEIDRDDGRLAIIVSHPCSMRSGPSMKDHVQVVRVIRCDPMNLEAWTKQFYDRLPLPDLTVVVDPDDVTGDDPEIELAVRTQEGAHAALFDLRGRVESCELDLNKRIACLTEQGVALLHQRMAHYDTRYAPDVDELVTTCTAVFAEIELWEQWNEQLIDSGTLSDSAKLNEELDRVAHIFDSELSKRRAIPDKKNGWYKLRDDLSIPKRHAAARREVLKILADYCRTLTHTGLN
jgi:hypothetical protein